LVDEASWPRKIDGKLDLDGESMKEGRKKNKLSLLVKIPDQY
jgi:hypothetical protein